MDGHGFDLSEEDLGRLVRFLGLTVKGIEKRMADSRIGEEEAAYLVQERDAFANLLDMVKRAPFVTVGYPRFPRPVELTVNMHAAGRA